MKKAVILARVSTLRQEEEGLSLDNQLQTLRDYALKHDLEVVQEFRFSESADLKIRKKFYEMIDFVKQSKDVGAIIAYRVDRITRNFRDAVLIDELRLQYNKEIHFVYNHIFITKNSTGREIESWDLHVFLAKQTINRLKEDAVNSASFMLKNGQWPVKAPYGYKNISLDGKNKDIVPDPVASGIVKQMYELYGTGAYSLLEIRRKMKELFGKDFSKGVVDFILKNPFYCGTMVYNEQQYPHNYERIVEPELFDQVQQIKASYNKKHHYKYAGLPYAYRGIMRCSECGCMITPEKSKDRYIYYHCTQYKGKHQAKWIREEDVTKQFESVFEALKTVPPAVIEQITQTLRESHDGKVRFYTQSITSLRTEYDKYETRISNMYDDKLDGSITESEYKERLNTYRTKQKELQKKMAQLAHADEEYYMTSEYLLELVKRGYELFKSSEPEEKRVLLKHTLQNFTYDGNSVRFDAVKPYDTVLLSAKRQAWLPREDSNLEPSSYRTPLVTKRTGLSHPAKGGSGI